MAIDFKEGRWQIERPTNDLDGFVNEFIRLFESQNIPYVLVSGYVAILFGRSRNSEDVDVFIDRLPFEKFESFWNAALKEFECVNAANAKEAYENYLSDGLAIRFSRKDNVIPNMEVRFPKAELDDWTLDHPVKAVLNGRPYATSPLELQIPFKLYLGSEKDLEDAKHLWLVSKEHLDKTLLTEFLSHLDKKHLAKTWLT